jgi:hypothetical protein
MLCTVNQPATALHMAGTPLARDQYVQIWIPGRIRDRFSHVRVRELIPGSYAYYPATSAAIFSDSADCVGQGTAVYKAAEIGLELSSPTSRTH